MLLANNIEDTSKDDFVEKMMQKLKGSTNEDRIYLDRYFDWQSGLIEHEEVVKLYVKTSFYKKQVK